MTSGASSPETAPDGSTGRGGHLGVGAGFSGPLGAVGSLRLLQQLAGKFLFPISLANIRLTGVMKVVF